MSSKSQPKQTNTSEAESANDLAPSEPAEGAVSAFAVEVDNDSLPVEGKAWQIAQLAAQVLNVRGVYEPGGENQLSHVSAANWQDERLLGRIKDSVRTARTLLEVVCDPALDERIAASTLFEPGVPLNANNIAKRFTEVGWKGLSENSIRTRLEEIDDCWNRLISEWESRGPQSLNSVENSIEKIVAALREVSQDPEVSQTIEGFDHEARELLCKIRKRYLSVPEYPPLMATKLRELHHWCFPIEGKERAVGAGVVYRIHELLRFAEAQLWKDSHYVLPPSTPDTPCSKSGPVVPDVWLATTLRPKKLADLRPPYNRFSFNSPPAFSDSFAAYNRQVTDPSQKFEHW